jgi:hypothetical protein
MGRYIARACPKCGEYFGIVMPERRKKEAAQLVNGLCALCGYTLAWKLIPGKRSSLLILQE